MYSLLVYREGNIVNQWNSLSQINIINLYHSKTWMKKKALKKEIEKSWSNFVTTLKIINNLKRCLLKMYSLILKREKMQSQTVNSSRIWDRILEAAQNQNQESVKNLLLLFIGYIIISSTLTKICTILVLVIKTNSDL